ncbi:hypothetical protein M413DRAFT_440657 [Hebeloma cylindrosporum]|uniref:Uncharacterized protein n=1 Tax=Hebeloma cylindrosporum TaxID=76867 RepID=A0A0C2Z1T0_HEBCY|nr:hypothetical protein M413DRAFT_440657 [Hebeloma cylindrosporum h7]
MIDGRANSTSTSIRKYGEYEDWKLKNMKKKKGRLGSETIREQVESALANYFGYFQNGQFDT